MWEVFACSLEEEEEEEEAAAAAAAEAAHLLTYHSASSTHIIYSTVLILMRPVPYHPPASFAAAGGRSPPLTYFPFANAPSTRTRLQKWNLALPPAAKVCHPPYYSPACVRLSAAQELGVRLSIKRDDETDCLAAVLRIT